MSKGYGTFDHVYCKMCYQDILPNFIEQYKDKLPANPKLDDVISNWDNIKAKENMIDLR